MVAINPQREKGVVIIVALVLLIVITLIGTSVSKIVTTSSSSTTNFIDRSQAFVDTEATIETAENIVFNAATEDEISFIDCSSTDCDPFPQDTAADWVEASSNISSLRTGLTPAYVIEKIGSTTTENETDTAISRNAAVNGYGEEPETGTANYIYFRVTARSHDSNSEVGSERAIVKIQTVIRRTF